MVQPASGRPSNSVPSIRQISPVARPARISALRSLDTLTCGSAYGAELRGARIGHGAPLKYGPLHHRTGIMLNQAERDDLLQPTTAAEVPELGDGACDYNWQRERVTRLPFRLRQLSEAHAAYRGDQRRQQEGHTTENI